MIGEAPNLVRLLSSSLPSISSRVLSPRSLASHNSSPLSVSSLFLSLAQRCVSSLSFRRTKIEKNPPFLVAPIPVRLLFLQFFFSVFNSLLHDSLDSLEDYVSCYYSSRGTHPRIPLRLTVDSIVFLLRRRCYSSSPAIDLLIFSLGESSARDNTSTASARLSLSCK